MTDKNNNSGDSNSGHYNSGHYNSGHRNSGDYNSGHRNSGHRNSGHRNSGHRNSGDYNSGHRNSGHCNSGDYNSGDSNSGHRNSGHCNSGDYNSGLFNTNEPNVRLFNVDTNLKREDIDLPYINLKTTEWIDECNMTLEQKTNDSEFHIKGGTLLTREYKDAWSIYWNEDSSECDRNKFLNLPNFCPKIFKEITGIDVEKNKTIIIDGKEIEISKESFEQFKKQFKGE